MNLEDFISALKKYDTSRIVFMGLGNELRNDDAAGLLFLRELRYVKYFQPSYFIEAERNPENYLEVILKYKPDAVIFIDAGDWEGTPGEIKWLLPEETSEIRFSTHTYSIKLIEQYLSAFKEIDFFYLGIQILNLNPGDSVSPEIRNSFKEFFIRQAAL